MSIRKGGASVSSSTTAQSDLLPPPAASPIAASRAREEARVRDLSGLPFWHVHRSRVGATSATRACAGHFGVVEESVPGLLGWQLTASVGRRLAVHTAGEMSPAPESASGAYAVDMTHAVAIMRLASEFAPAVLAKICPIDFSRRPDAFALRTSMAQVGVEVVRHGVLDGDVLLLVPRSFGPYFYGVLRDAAC